MNQYYERAKDKSVEQIRHMLACLSGSKCSNPDAIAAYELLIQEKQGEDEPVKQAEQHEDYLLSRAYTQKAQNSYKRGIDFMLSFQEFKRLKKKKRCAYTGVKFEQEGQNILTFDRIDGGLPYTKENTVVCTHAANQIKNDLFEDPQRSHDVSVSQVARMLDKLKELGIYD